MDTQNRNIPGNTWMYMPVHIHTHEKHKRNRIESRREFFYSQLKITEKEACYSPNPLSKQTALYSNVNDMNQMKTGGIKLE